MTLKELINKLNKNNTSSCSSGRCGLNKNENPPKEDVDDNE